MPGAVPFTSTLALNNSTLEYGLKIAEDIKAAIMSDIGLALGLNTYKGALTCKPVTTLFNLPYTSPNELFS